MRPRLSGLKILEQSGGQIPFREGGNDHDDRLALHAVALSGTDGRSKRCAGGNADRQPFRLGNFARHCKGFVIGDRCDFVKHRRVQHAGYETGTDSLNLVRARIAAAQHRAVGRLHRDNVKVPACAASALETRR